MPKIIEFTIEAGEKIKTQIYDYHLIHTITESGEKDNLDIDYIEILLRDKFLLGKKGETVYIIKNE